MDINSTCARDDTLLWQSPFTHCRAECDTLLSKDVYNTSPQLCVTFHTAVTAVASSHNEFAGRSTLFVECRQIPGMRPSLQRWRRECILSVMEIILKQNLSVVYRRSTEAGNTKSFPPLAKLSGVFFMWKTSGWKLTRSSLMCFTYGLHRIKRKHPKPSNIYITRPFNSYLMVLFDCVAAEGSSSSADDGTQRELRPGPSRYTVISRSPFHRRDAAQPNRKSVDRRRKLEEGEIKQE